MNNNSSERCRYEMFTLGLNCKQVECLVLFLKIKRAVNHSDFDNRTDILNKGNRTAVQICKIK